MAHPKDGSGSLRPRTAVLTRGFDPSLSFGSARPAVFRSSTYVFASPEAAERAFSIASGRIPAVVSVGVAIGISAALGLAPIVSSMLFGIMPRDPVMISVAVLVMSVVATLAGYLPARRASLVDPLSALRRD